MQAPTFFNDGKADLAPLTDLRGAGLIRTGMLATVARWELFLSTSRQGATTTDDNQILAVNDRCLTPPYAHGIDTLQPGESIVDETTNTVLAAVITPDQLDALGAGDNPAARTTTVTDHPVLSRPWHIRTHRDRCIRFDLDLAVKAFKGTEHSVPPHAHVIGDHPLMLGDADILPAVVLDARNGPIVIRSGATIRPGAVITGPAAILEHAVVNDNAVIKANTVIGPHCRVGGEIGGTIFQGYANKAHEGHLGDSWVGEWANLGAGTTNSNLLNTYGVVKMTNHPDRPPEPTGETFLGAIIGDHVKTAIGTRIMTGAVIMTGAMYAASTPVTRLVPRFAWVTDEKAGTYDLRKFIDVKRTVMARRAREPSDEYIARIEQLHGETVNA